MDRKYEVLLLLNPNLEKEDLEKLLKNVETKLGGSILKKEDWGVKDLAYKINKSKKGYYVLYYVETTSENIISLKEMIAINKDIIRPMILRHERKWPFEYKTAKELKFPERKPRNNNGRRPDFKRDSARAEFPKKTNSNKS